MMEIAYIRVKNFSEFQHYKDRNPPWIKLYNKLLDDYEFSCLQDASKLHLVMIWLLASRTDNKIPADPEWIAKKINATEDIDLTVLINAGFIEKVEEKQQLKSVNKDDSKVIADCNQNACLETETETETEEDIVITTIPCPHQKIIDLYRKALPLLPDVRVWTPRRKANLQARWREDRERQTLDWWTQYFEHVSRSRFLTGKVPGHNGQPPFVADLEWLILPSNMVKVIEGKYHREAQ